MVTIFQEYLRRKLAPEFQRWNLFKERPPAVKVITLGGFFRSAPLKDKTDAESALDALGRHVQDAEPRWAPRRNPRLWYDPDSLCVLHKEPGLAGDPLSFCVTGWRINAYIQPKGWRRRLHRGVA